MNILIFGGFLGSGKTTSLMQLAKYIVDHSTTDNPNKVMILENEIGEVGIDDAFLRSGGFKVDNLFAGCACCTVSGELVSSASRIEHDYNPEWLVVETTGLAYPKKIQENVMNAMKIRARIAVLVDASRWARLHKPMENLFKGQIVGSDVVVINKADLVDEVTMNTVDSDIHEYEPNVNIFHVSAISPVNDEVWKGVIGE